MAAEERIGAFEADAPRIELDDDAMDSRDGGVGARADRQRGAWLDRSEGGQGDGGEHVDRGGEDARGGAGDGREHEIDGLGAGEGWGEDETGDDIEGVAVREGGAGVDDADADGALGGVRVDSGWG